MVRIVSDTSTLYSTAQAEAAGFSVSPLSVTIAGKSYREFDEISADGAARLAATQQLTDTASCVLNVYRRTG